MLFYHTIVMCATCTDDNSVVLSFEMLVLFEEHTKLDASKIEVNRHQHRTKKMFNACVCMSL